MDPDPLVSGQKSVPTDLNPFLPPPMPVTIPDHELLRCIGQGSYGTVWLARNSMGTHRAVKIVYRTSFSDKRPYERELSGIRRFEPISRSYEGFVDILQVGINEEQGYFYYVMELGDDPTTGQAIDPDSYAPKTLAKELLVLGRFSFQECLRLGLALSQALAELHKHGLVHRDVKPSNIIFVNGVPKLADIGLVADVNEARSYVGTEGFIPPEGPGTPQADVYSLGKLLYECCTGKDRQEFPELPTRLDQLPDREHFVELNEVILQACKNDPAERYRTAWEMQADLLLLANGQSVKRLRILERRLARFKRVAWVSLLTLFVAAVAGYQVYREWQHSREARQRSVGANLTQGDNAVASGDLLGSLPYFVEALRLDQQNQNEAINDRLRIGSLLANSPRLTHLWVRNRRVNSGEFSPDGSRVLVAEYHGEAGIYDLRTEQYLPLAFPTNIGLYTAAFSKDGRWIATANEDSTVRLCNTTNPGLIFTLHHPDFVSRARFSPDGLHLVTACGDGVARVWDVATKQCVMSLSNHTAKVSYADFSPDGQLIVTTSSDNTARLWEAKDGYPVGSPLVHDSWVVCAGFSPDCQRIVTAGLDLRARVWDVATGKRIFPDLMHGDGVISAEFSPDGRVILTASWDGTARLWSADSLQPLDSNPILRHGERLTGAHFSPDGHSIVTTDIGGTTRIWSLAGVTLPPAPTSRSFSEDGSRFVTFTTTHYQVRDASSCEPVSPSVTTKEPLTKVRLNRNGTFAMTLALLDGETNHTVCQLGIREVATGKSIGEELIFTNVSSQFQLSDEGTRLVVFNSDHVWCCDVPTGAVRPLALSNSTSIASVWISRQGDHVAAKSGNKVLVWDAATGRMLYPPLQHITEVRQAAFSPDGTRLITCCWDFQFTKCYAQNWDASTGQPIGPRLKQGDGVLGAAYSPDGSRIVTAGEDSKAIVWDATTGQQLTPPLRHVEKVLTATFSPDGKWIVTASYDRTARVWDSESGDPLTPPLRHLARVLSARFLADGRRILTTDVHGKSRVWGLPVDMRPIADLRSIACLLCGNSVTPIGQFAPPESEPPDLLWHRLRAKYPATFSVTRQEIAAWHEFQAEECEAERNPNAAALHLQRVQATQSANDLATGPRTR